MKILGSKFQDFYEFDCYKYGEPSPLPEWFRHTYIADDSKQDKSVIIDSKSTLYNTIKSLFLRNVNPHYDWRGKGKYSRAYNTTSIYIDEQIIGIYPYLYYIPEIGPLKKTGNIIFACGQFIDEVKVVPFKAEDAKRLLLEKDSFKEILPNYGIDYTNAMLPEQIIHAGEDTSYGWLDYRSRNIKDPFVIECSEIFDKLNAPIIRFVDKSFKHNKLNADLNINISKTPFLRYYPDILSERDVYTEIENWVIASQREPEHIPDNKTKILSHGFDLKTSFRKM